MESMTTNAYIFNFPSYYDDNYDDTSRNSDNSIDTKYENSESESNFECLRSNCDADNESNCDSWDSTCDLLSFESVDLSQSYRIHSNKSGRFDFTSSFCPSILEVPQAPLEGIEVLSSLPFILPQRKSGSPETETQNRQPAKLISPTYFNERLISKISGSKEVKSGSRINDNSSSYSIPSKEIKNDIGLEYSHSTIPHVEDTSMSSYRSTSEVSEPMRVEIRNELMNFIDTTNASNRFTIPSQSSNSSQSDQMLASHSELIPRAVKFANECLERSRVRRTSTDYHIYSNSSYPVALHKSFVIIPSNSFQSFKSSRIAEPHFSSDSSISSDMSSSSALSTNSSFESFSQSSLCRQLEEMKMKLNTMKIKHCQQKCMRSLKRSMVLYMKIDASSNDDDSTICTIESFSTIPISHITFRSEAASRAKMVSQLVNEMMCFNIIFAMLWMIFLLYKGLLFSELQDDSFQFTSEDRDRKSVV